MRKLNIGILDLVAKGPTRNLWARTIHANLASIMPQAIATWCEEEGHTVTYVCYTGLENLLKEFPKTLDVLILGTFSYGAQLAYALSNFFRSTGAVTVLGGSHARCYPQDAQKYFDYVLGFTDRTVIRDLLPKLFSTATYWHSSFSKWTTQDAAGCARALEVHRTLASQGAMD